MRFISLIIVFAMPLITVGQIQDLVTDKESESVEPITQLKEEHKFIERFKRNWKEPYPNPLRASVFSLIIPGTGQIYIKRYWKAPIVWGGLVGVGYLINYNLEQRDRFEEAYGKRVAGIPGDEFEGIIPNAEGIKRYRDLHEKWLQQSYIGFVAVWVLNSLEAYVDAHLKNFDISDDLSLQIIAGPLEGLYGTTGISIRMYF